MFTLLSRLITWPRPLATEAFLDDGTHVTITSSSPERVDSAVKRLNNLNVHGVVGDARNKAAFVEVLRFLAPIDHLVFRAWTRSFRGPLEDLELNEAKPLFGVKIWGAVICETGEHASLLLQNSGRTAPKAGSSLASQRA